MTGCDARADTPPTPFLRLLRHLRPQATGEVTFFTFPATSTLASLTGDGGARRLRQCRCHQRPLHRGIRSGTRRVRLSRCHTCEPAERHCPRRKTRPAPRIQRSMRQKVRPAHVLLSTTGFFVSGTFFPFQPPHATQDELSCSAIPIAVPMHPAIIGL